MSEQQNQSTTLAQDVQKSRYGLLNELEEQKKVITQLSDEELEVVSGGVNGEITKLTVSVVFTATLASTGVIAYELGKPK